jgi:hypothetical protein
MLPDQNSIKAFHVYTYTFLDDLSSIKSPFEHFQYEERYLIEDAIRLVGERFKEFGWEGDGSIGIIWLPPFVDVGTEDTYGTYIWHVKQMNNGISFLASDPPLDFKRLAAQNIEFTSGTAVQDMVPITIIETDVKWFVEAIKNTKDEVQAALSLLGASGSIDAQRVLVPLLFHYQNVLVRLFNEFLDECYLRVLIEAIESGNPHRIKLRKTRVEVDATLRILEREDSEEETAFSAPNAEFTIRGLISDMWKAFKWEPFKTKTDMLFKSLDYTPNETAFFEIRKHVVLRNCMQHHEARLDRDSLKTLGRDKLFVRDSTATKTIDVWKPIIITLEELFSLISILLGFAEDFHKYVAQRIPTRHFMSRSTNN